MVCQMPYAMMFQIGKDFVGVALETRAGDAILVLEQEWLFVLNMESKHTHLLHLLYYCCVETFCPNPGPRNIKYPCGICKKAVRTNQDGILCDVCERWFHTRRQCLNMSEETYKAYSDNVSLQWICNRCSDIQRDEADLNTTCENEGFTSVKNSLSEHPGLEVGHMNVNGLRGKLPEVKMLLQNTGLDILAITENQDHG